MLNTGIISYESIMIKNIFISVLVLTAGFFAGQYILGLAAQTPANHELDYQETEMRRLYQDKNLQAGVSKILVKKNGPETVEDLPGYGPDSDADDEVYDPEEVQDPNSFMFRKQTKAAAREIDENMRAEEIEILKKEIAQDTERLQTQGRQMLPENKKIIEEGLEQKEARLEQLLENKEERGDYE
jgi:hypothetical protein